jgi:acetyl-CoA/propionyl-CoA carboxylase biotin carboxyl carrier protein
VEHPVSEEVTGIDLVREQFRIARGEKITDVDPEVNGHSIEFRINGEDPGRGFLPAPGSLTRWELPSGPGVRVDAGFRSGDVIGGNFDSLLAKLIITGKDRTEALQRARRALAEFQVDGIATALTFHRVVVNEDDFAPADGSPFRVHTRWIETEFDNRIPAYDATVAADTQQHERQSVVVEVQGKRIEVTLPAGLGAPTASTGAKKATGRKRGGHSAAVSGDSVTAPMQGTIVKVEVAEGQSVNEGDLIVVLEAMKMEQPLTAHKAGTVAGLSAQIGATVSAGAAICEIKD